MNLDKQFAHLSAGVSYTVRRPFVDYDAIPHPSGEKWLFLGSSFLPYDDGLSLFAMINGKITQVRLQWREETQAEMIDHINQYLEAEPCRNA